MAKWTITRLAPDEPEELRIKTGEVYDDTAGSVDDYLAEITARDGWAYGAVPLVEEAPL